VLWSLANDITAKVEGRGKRLDDVSVYATLARIIDEESQGQEATNMDKMSQV
jgi:hypothetical protein